jgi:hypothetical protein
LAHIVLHINRLHSNLSSEHFDVRATGLTGVVPTEVCELELDILWAGCEEPDTDPNALVCHCCEDC